MALHTAADSEWVTRKQLVDKELRAAGRQVTPYTEKALARFDRCAVEEFPTTTGPADYALILRRHVHAKPLSNGAVPLRGGVS